MRTLTLWCRLAMLLPLLAGGAHGAVIDPANPPLDPVIELMDKEPRVALIIGNGAYEKWAPLSNARNDAQRMAEVLTRFKFDIIVVLDGDRRRMEEGIARFANKLRGGGVALVFYAGHGIQYAGQNYLIPVDAQPLSTDNMEQGMQLGWLLSLMSEASTRMNIAIIDACRVPPMASGSRISVAGLAQPKKARSTLISFATAPDSVASDGRGDNSPFSESLAENIEKFPGHKIEDVLKRVLADVKRKTGNEQEPWQASTIDGDFYFDPRQADPDAVPFVAAPSAAPAAVAYTRLPGWRELGRQMFARSESSYTELDVVRAVAQRKRVELLWQGARQLQHNPAHTLKAAGLLSTLNDVRADCDQLIERGQVTPCEAQLDRVEMEVTMLGGAPTAVQVGLLDSTRGGDSGVAPAPVQRPISGNGGAQRLAVCDPAQGEPEVLFPDWRSEVTEQDRQRGRKLYARIHCLCDAAGANANESMKHCRGEVRKIRELAARKRLDEAEKHLARLTQSLRK